MLAIVACTKCGEVKAITNRSVVFPFVCDGCQKLHECFGECCETTGGNNGENQ